MRIICPFIKRATAKRLFHAGRPKLIRVLTRFNPSDFCDGVSDLAALRLLLENGAQIKGVRNLHAKLCLFGQSRVIVTSANLTEIALQRNHEFGFVASDETIIRRCREYFDRLWRGAGTLLTAAQLAAWEIRIESARAQGAGPSTRHGLKDYGTDVGFEPPVAETASFPAFPGQAFVKFLGAKNLRSCRNERIFDEINGSGTHWACTYRKGKRPKRVRDGDVMFMARMVQKPNDYLIYGRGIGMAYQQGRDDATDKEITLRPWKKDCPYYIRVDRTEFINGALADGISLNRLMRELGSDAFFTTQAHATAGNGNTDPRQSLKQQPHVLLSMQGYAWMQREFYAALGRHGRLSSVDLARLDWPTAP